MRFAILGVFVLTASLGAQQLDCVRVDGSGGAFSLSCQPKVVEPPPPPPTTSAPAISDFRATPTTITVGQSTVLSWTVTGSPTPTLSLNQGIGAVTGSSRTWTPTTTGQRVVTLTASNGIGKPATQSWTVTVNPVVTPPPPPPPPPPPTTGAIWPGGVTDVERLGTCTAAQHDEALVDGGDGFVYYTWHPRQHRSGCWFGHEHGPDPAPAIAGLVTEINRHEAAGRLTAAQASAARSAATAPLLMGRVARLMPMPGEPNGHVEPHEGFKVFYADRGEVNDENRVSTIAALFLTHMGTGGVGRFAMPHHSVIGRQVHSTGALQFTELMLDFGTANTVCNPRVAPTRDVIAILTSPCGIDSPYEIWTGERMVLNIGRAKATPAVFDPITVMNRSNPTELVFAWDPRVLVTRNHDGDSWAGFRGCSRESYAQMPDYFVTGFHDVRTGPSGEAGGTLRQVLYSTSTNPQDVLGTVDGNSAFKVRRNHCQGPTLGLKN